MSGFFEESTEQSRVKATIVADYFWAWAKVIIPWARRHGGRIAHVDLFAGPGRYVDGTKSTPLLVLEKAIADQQMREMLVTVFNDLNSDHSRSLEASVSVHLLVRPLVFRARLGGLFAADWLKTRLPLTPFKHAQIVA